MKLKLGTNEIFHCPEGRWSGICEAVDEPKQRINKPCAAQIRLRFRVETDEGEKLVGKMFCADMSYGSELYSYLESWLGGNFDKYLDEDGNIDLDLLIGKRADLHIIHGLQTAGNDYPFVNIAGIYPAGTFTEE